MLRSVHKSGRSLRTVRLPAATFGLVNTPRAPTHPFAPHEKNRRWVAHHDFLMEKGVQESVA